MSLTKVTTIMLAAGTLILAGCSSPFRTLEWRDGKLTMTEERGGKTSQWELKQVATKAEANALRRAGWTFAGVVHLAGSSDTYLLQRKMQKQPQPAAQSAAPPFHPMLITNFCTQTSLDGTWRIAVSEASVAVSRFPGLTGHGWPARAKEGETTVSVPWTSHTGWLVFAENDHRVWYYDGDRLLMLFTFSETWNRESWTSGDSSSGPFYGDQSCPVPAEVFTHLSEQARKKVQNHA